MALNLHIFILIALQNLVFIIPHPAFSQREKYSGRILKYDEYSFQHGLHVNRDQS
jgi:hypothetical protein